MSPKRPDQHLQEGEEGLPHEEPTLQIVPTEEGKQTDQTPPAIPANRLKEILDGLAEEDHRGPKLPN